MRIDLLILTLTVSVWPIPEATAQSRDPAVIIASQVEAMRALSMIDGIWRGEATVIQADRSRLTFVQTERIGPFLGGSVKMIEGRGYDDAGRVRFNALGIISYDPSARAFTMHSHAQGHVGDFVFVPTSQGYRWDLPIGGATIRYVATVKDGELHETGDRVVDGREPIRIFEMRLRRIGDTDWPAAGAVPPSRPVRRGATPPSVPT